MKPNRKQSFDKHDLAGMTPDEAQSYGEATMPDANLEAMSRRGADAPMAVPVAALIETAIREKMPAAELERLFALAEKMADRQAGAALNAALADFRKRCPSIRKTQTAKIATNSGTGYSYTFADLAEIARTVDPILADLGLSYAWDSTMDGGNLTCVCTVRHAQGATLQARFTSPTESRAGMSAQQKNASALTYARRQSLVQALGLTTCDPDNDGSDDYRDRDTGALISDEQRETLETLIATLNVDINRFCTWCKVDRLDKLPAAHYARAKAALDERAAKARAGA